MAVLLVTHPPDRVVAVFADEKAAVLRHGDSHRAAPDFALGRNKTRYEIFVFTARFAGRMIEWHAHDFIAGAFHPVP